MCDRMRPESQVRSGLAAGGRWIRTIRPATMDDFLPRYHFDSVTIRISARDDC
jgi:hypothetical protein